VWLIVIFFAFAAACFFSAARMTEADWRSSMGCPKIGCIVLEPLLKALPLATKKGLFYILGALFALGAIQFARLQIQRPLALVMDSAGVHFYHYGKAYRHVAWNDVAALVSKRPDIILRLASAPEGSLPPTLRFRSYDVSEIAALGVIEKYRPDLQLMRDRRDRAGEKDRGSGHRLLEEEGMTGGTKTRGGLQSA